VIAIQILIALIIVAQLPTKDVKGEKKADSSILEEVMESEELPVIDPFSYTYNPFGKRDPFETFISSGGSGVKVSENPLLNYDLSKFRLTGVVWGMANPRGIVQDGGGLGHIVRRGTRIGRNRGKIMRILKDRIVVAEEFRDPLGKLIVSEYSMKLNTEGAK